MEVSQNFISKSRDPLAIPFDVILHFFYSAACSESVKYNANIFSGDRYMAILLLCRFGCEMPIPAHFAEVFGGLAP